MDPKSSQMQKAEDAIDLIYSSLFTHQGTMKLGAKTAKSLSESTPQRLITDVDFAATSCRDPLHYGRIEADEIIARALSQLFVRNGLCAHNLAVANMSEIVSAVGDTNAELSTRSDDMRR